MKTTVLGSAVAFVCCVATPFAQQQPNPTPAHNVFVAIGCLTSGGDRAAAAFKLTDASSIGRTAPARAGEAGAVGTSGLKASYALEPATGVNAQGINADELKAHVGQRVEVILRPIQTTVALPPAGAGLGIQLGRRTAAPPERYTVTEIKGVTGPCS
jgi:hypothetical protein